MRSENEQPKYRTRESKCAVFVTGGFVLDARLARTCREIPVSREISAQVILRPSERSFSRTSSGNLKVIMIRI